MMTDLHFCKNIWKPFFLALESFLRIANNALKLDYTKKKTTFKGIKIFLT